MVVHAIKKDGGLFIPGTENVPLDQGTVSIELVIVDDIYDIKNKLNRSSGILKDRKTDGCKYQKSIRKEWD